MLNFTRGPWRWDGDSLWHFGKGYHDKDDPHIFTGILMESKLMDSEMLQSNAHLVAAAPEMYKELKAHCNDCDGRRFADHYGDDYCGDCKTRAAIAKAEGRREWWL